MRGDFSLFTGYSYISLDVVYQGLISHLFHKINWVIFLSLISKFTVLSVNTCLKRNHMAGVK